MTQVKAALLIRYFCTIPTINIGKNRDYVESGTFLKYELVEMKLTKAHPTTIFGSLLLLLLVPTVQLANPSSLPDPGMFQCLLGTKSFPMIFP